MKPSVLGKKQRMTHEAFLDVFRNVERHVSRVELDDLIGQTVAEIRATCAGKRAAFAWSGGKDSIALEHCMKLAGVEPCVLAITDLEFPAFLQWATDNMPAGLEVVNTGQDLHWLARNPEMFFPRDAATAGRWFKVVQHTAQERYFRKHKLDVLALGRRHQDGNFTGRGGAGIYTSDGITRYSPIREWRHEDVFAVVHYYGLKLPPTYDWPRGFRVGTGPWPARQWTASFEAGLEEVWAIDPNVLREAAKALGVVADFLRTRGLA